MPNSAIISKSMPAILTGSTDRDNSFSLGRHAFFNKNFKSSQTPYKNIDYSNVTNSKTSNIFAKPLPNTSSDLRTQRLRMTAIGAGSTRLKNNTDNINYKGASPDYNYVNNVLSRVRGGGAVAPKKGK